MHLLPRERIYRAICIAPIRGIHIQTHRLMERFMKYAVEEGLGAMIYTPSFIYIG
jgi:hypothetical protein